MFNVGLIAARALTKPDEAIYCSIAYTIGKYSSGFWPFWLLLKSWWKSGLQGRSGWSPLDRA